MTSVTKAHALISYLHTVIKFLLSTAPFLAAAFFRAALNPRLRDAIPASCAALRSSWRFPFFLSCPPHGGVLQKQKRRITFWGRVPISYHCSLLSSACEYYATYGNYGNLSWRIIWARADWDAALASFTGHVRTVTTVDIKEGSSHSLNLFLSLQ